MNSSTLREIEKLGIHKIYDSKPIVVVGVGNITQSDDGLGIQAVYELMDDQYINSKADILEAGNRVFDFLECIDKREKAIVIDAYEGGELPGCLHRRVFNLEDFNSKPDIPISFHDFTFVDAILSAKDIFTLPSEIVILGIEPLQINAGMELSSVVKRSLPKLISEVRKEVGKWQ